MSEKPQIVSAVPECPRCHSYMVSSRPSKEKNIYTCRDCKKVFGPKRNFIERLQFWKS